MAKTAYCPLCKKNDMRLVYSVTKAPIFQNKVYTTEYLAKNASSSNIDLVTCKYCGFVFNALFDPECMAYDSCYENEQAHSGFFQEYLLSIVNLFREHSFQDKKIIEIGCGKGYFLETLKQEGFNITGFDPAYVGDNPAIIKDYFGAKYSDLSADVIVLRHVLEHIQYPLDFLHSIGKACSYKAKIYIEVPALEWIVANSAFWDIFYEHCNYFSLEVLKGMFQDAEYGSLFNDQYMYIIADLKDIKIQNQGFESKKSDQVCLAQLTDLIAKHRYSLNKDAGTAIWGAGAKGVTFANLIDPDAQLISCLIDINPKKQMHYVAGTGHKIISPTMISNFLPKKILVMNNNYLSEIKEVVAHLDINVESL